MHLHGSANRRVTPFYPPSPVWRYHNVIRTKSSARKCKWTLNLTVVYTHRHVTTWWRVKDSPGSYEDDLDEAMGYESDTDFVGPNVYPLATVTGEDDTRREPSSFL